MLGFPIRTSADQCLVDGSPQLFAVTHVLHRFLAPRHPPLALCSLEEQRCSCLLCSSQRAANNDHQLWGDAIRATTEGLDPSRSERCGSGLHLPEGGAVVPDAESDPIRGRLPQNGREDKVRRATRSRGKPTNDRNGRLTHQCTNWELVRTEPDKCRPTVERCSLERR